MHSFSSLAPHRLWRWCHNHSSQGTPRNHIPGPEESHPQAGESHRQDPTPLYPATLPAPLMVPWLPLFTYSESNILLGGLQFP